MNSWARYLDKVLKGHDSCLFVQETKLGRYDVYRKSSFGCNPPYYVMSLTDTWKANGTPRNWGIDVVLNRVKANDLWNNPDFMNDFVKQNEAIEASKDRAFKNDVEAFLYDFRSEFHKATSDINTASLDKVPLKY